MDTEGVEALSMRRLSKNMGIGVMTIYNYIRNIDEIKREILVRGFDIRYEQIFTAMGIFQSQGLFGLIAYAEAFAYAMYDFSVEHHHICSYLIGEGCATFRKDAELRPLYSFFNTVLLPVEKTDEGMELRNACEMMEAVVLSAVHRNLVGTKKYTHDEYQSYIRFSLRRIFPEEAKL
jgi:AcrR family transcriptional regulator